MSASAAAPVRLAPAAHHAAAPPPACTRPFIGIAAVLLGAVISTLYSRITTFGLADLRGAVHAGFDEGAWIATASTVGQMAVGPLDHLSWHWIFWQGAILAVPMLICIHFGMPRQATNREALRADFWACSMRPPGSRCSTRRWTRATASTG